MKQQLIYFLSCISLAFVFVSFFGDATSPFKAEDIVVWDASIFQEIGYQWSQGNIPYLSVWDHKGPLIFLFDAVGFLLSGDKSGIFVMEILLISIFFFITLKTFLLRFSFPVSIFFTILSFFILAGLYAGGNNVEELLLPFWSLCVYNTIKWLDSSDRRIANYNPWNGFLIGILFAIGFLTRLTNAAGACGLLAAVCILLLINKKRKELISTILMFFVGTVVLLFPFFLYFHLHNALDEMLFSTIGVNISYTTHDIVYPIRKYISNLVCGFSYFGTIFFSLYLFFFYKEKRPRALVWFLASLMMGLWMFPGRQFTKYVINCIPFYPVMMIELFDLRTKGLSKTIITSSMVLISIILLSNVRFIHPFREAPYIIPLTKTLSEDIPNNEHNQLMGYGFSAQMYLNLDITPCYRNFVSQESHATLSNRIKETIIHDFSSCKAKWIIVQGETSLIQETLDHQYILYKTYPNIGTGATLYKRIIP